MNKSFKKTNNSIYVEDENGNIIASILFIEKEKGVFDITKTFVHESLRGQGIAALLVEEAIREIRSRNGKITASCSYAKKYLEKNS